MAFHGRVSGTLGAQCAATPVAVFQSESVAIAHPAPLERTALRGDGGME
jgi:hypothetical protein